MLQQTQVDRVIPKYRQFLRRFPSLRALARAPVEDVRQLWYPLGYNVRPLRLHAIACETVARYGGRLPDDAERAARDARHRPLHGRRGAVVRLRARRRGARHQRAPGADAASSSARAGPRACAATERCGSWPSGSCRPAAATTSTRRSWTSAPPGARRAGRAARPARCGDSAPPAPPAGRRRGLDPVPWSSRSPPALIRDAAGRYLITQRRRGSHLAGLWEFPGGKRRGRRDARPPACAASSSRSCRRRSRWASSSRPSAGSIRSAPWSCTSSAAASSPATIAPREQQAHGMGRARAPGRLRLPARRPRADRAPSPQRKKTSVTTTNSGSRIAPL